MRKIYRAVAVTAALALSIPIALAFALVVDGLNGLVREVKHLKSIPYEYLAALRD